jgi:primase-polymerase (primpol)-like protein
MTAFDLIPEELKRLPRWVTWREEASSTGKPTKVPYVAGTNQRAASTNPATWRAFEEACAGVNGHGGGLGWVVTAE